MSKSHAARRILALAAASLAATPIARASISNWTGGGGNAYWSNPSNWGPIGTPTDTVDVDFATSFISGTLINLGVAGAAQSDVECHSITIPSATNFSLNYQSQNLVIATGTINRSALTGTTVLNTSLLLPSSYFPGAYGYNWNVAGTGTLTYSGLLSYHSAHFFNGSEYYQPNSITKGGSGTLVLAHNTIGDLGILGTFDTDAFKAWDGPLNVTAGVARLQNLGYQADPDPSAAVVSSGATLDISNSSVYTDVTLAGQGVGFGAMRVGGGNCYIQSITASAGCSINVTDSTLTVTGGFSCPSAGDTVTKYGPGVVSAVAQGGFSGFNGSFKITDGSVIVAGANALGNAAAVTVAGTGSLALDLNNSGLGLITLSRPMSLGGAGPQIFGAYLGALSLVDVNLGADASNVATSSGKVTLTSGTSLRVDAAATLNLNGQIVESGPGSGITKLGGGRLSLGGANSFTGPIYVAEGTLAVNNASAIPSGVATTVPPGSALEVSPGLSITRTLFLNGTGVGNAGALRFPGGGAWVSSINLQSDSTIDAGAGTLSIGAFLGSYNVTKIGAGTLALSSNGSTFKSLNIGSGTLALTTDVVIPAAAPVTVAPTGAISLTNTGLARKLAIAGTGPTGLGALRNLAGSNALSSPVALTGDATFSIDAGTLAASGAITGGATLTKSGPGRIALSGANTFPSLIVAGGTAAFSTQASIGALGDVATYFNSTLEIPASLNATFDLVSGGEIHFTGTTGGTFGGNIALNLNAAINVDAAASALISTSGFLYDNAGPHVLTKSGLGTLTLDINNSVAGGLVVSQGTLRAQSDLALGASGSPITISPGAKLSFAATTASANRTYNAPAGFLAAEANASVTLTGSTINAAILRGPGLFVLGAGNAVNSVSALPGANVLVTSPTQLSYFTSSANLTVNANATWDGGFNQSAGAVTINSGATLAVNSFENDGAITINPGGALTNDVSNLTTSTAGSRITIGSKATPGGSLTLLNGTTLELNGALLSNNGTLAGTVDVNYGSLAKGSGIYGTVKVNDGGKFSPGNSPGTVTTGDVTWNAGGQYLVEVTDATGVAGTGYDAWNINGNLTVAGGNTTNSKFIIGLASLSTPTTAGLASNFSASNTYTWQVAHVTGAINGFDPSSFAVDTSGFLNPLAGTTFSIMRVGAGLYVSNGPASLTIPVGHTLSQGRIVIPSLTVSGTAVLDAGGGHAGEIGTLAMPNDGAGHYAGRIDLMDSDLVLHATPEAAVGDMIRAWYDNGARDGNGLGSSFASQPGSASLLTLGLLTNSDGMGGALYATFDGISLFPGDVIVKYTYLGDTDLNGRVDGADLANLFAGMTGGLTGWVNGDMNHDGVVDPADLTLLVSGLRGQGTPLGGGPDGDGGTVPEPGTLAGIAALAPLLMRRRR